VALSTAKLKEWLATDLSGLELLVIQIDGLYVGDHVLAAAKRGRYFIEFACIFRESDFSNGTNQLYPALALFSSSESQTIGRLRCSNSPQKVSIGHP
jgi:hypothetical protein